MIDFADLIKDFCDCDCGRTHRSAVSDIRTGTDVTEKIGLLLARGGFPDSIVLICDKNTEKYAKNITFFLNNFKAEIIVIEPIRYITHSDVSDLADKITDGCGVISVGSGTLCDLCRLVCAEKSLPFCVYATAPSNCGYALDSSFVYTDGCLLEVKAKYPEIIIADSEVLAAAPKTLKSAGFGELCAVYTALIDWRVASICLDEYYCEKTAALARYATDSVMLNADSAVSGDSESVQNLFDSLILCGICSQFSGSTRPFCGTEHTLALLWQSTGFTGNGKKNRRTDSLGACVGVASLFTLRFYKDLLTLGAISCHKPKKPDDLPTIIRKYKSTIENVQIEAEPLRFEENWEKVRDVLNDVPSYDDVLGEMKLAGCLTGFDELGIEQKEAEESFKYHTQLETRPSLMLFSEMIDFTKVFKPIKSQTESTTTKKKSNQ